MRQTITVNPEEALKDSSVIVLEFNELTPHLTYRWMAEGKLPGFKRLFGESVVYLTDAQEPQSALEPDMQWATVHSGLTTKERDMVRLGGGYTLRAPRLWDVASRVGKRVWICGSIDAGAASGASVPVNGMILPDPFSTGRMPHPAWLFKDFFRVVQNKVRRYARDAAPLRAADYFRFAAFMLRNGLTLSTLGVTIRQVVSRRGPGQTLDRIMWDVFRENWRRIRPHYGTVFLNSTPQPRGHQGTLRAYQALDRIVSEACDLVAGGDTSLIMMTALSPLPPGRDNGGSRYQPDGMFWVRSRGARARIVPGKVPLRRTTATIAELAGLDAQTIRKQFVSPALDPAEATTLANVAAWVSQAVGGALHSAEDSAMNSSTLSKSG